MATIQMNAYLSNGARVLTSLPPNDRITVKAVREATETLRARIEQQRESVARVHACDAAVTYAQQNIEREAAAAAEDGGTVDAKKLSKKVRVAEENLEEARLETRAREAAVSKAYHKLVDTIEKHTPALRDAAMGKIESSILKLTTARKQVEAAAAELDEHFGMVGLVDRIAVDRLPVMLNDTKSDFHAQLAVSELGAAVASAMESFDHYRGAGSSKVDVEVPMPGEDVVPDPAGSSAVQPAALGDLTIGADDE